MRSLTFFSEVPFAALLVYSPRGVTATSKQSKRITLALKENARVATPAMGAMTMARYLSLRLAQELPRTPFPTWFSDAVLVPIPRSAPMKTRALWPPFEIATELIAQGIGRDVIPLLKRATAVPKSAFCAAADRPGPLRHRDSFVVTGELPLGTRRIILIDDVVTRGASLMGAAMRLRDSFERVEITAFAAVRTVSDGEVGAVLDPCVGTIRRDGDRVARRP